MTPVIRGRHFVLPLMTTPISYTTLMNGLQKTTIFDNNQPRKARVDPVVRIMREQGEINLPATQVSRVLYKARGVWPFDFMPDDIIVEEERLIVINNYFPFGSDIGTLPMGRISSIEVTHALFFSSLNIQCTELHGYSAIVKWLRHKDAQQIKEIVDGIKIQAITHAKIPESSSYGKAQTYQSIGNI